ncbi:hypothetical protein [Rubrivirga sp. IMCC45206]|uniref:hypothetical protein n=1 Tax=Rubrivirga sp. IMCC45206 TaxID=3391614 RepID=UPI00399036C9
MPDLLSTTEAAARKGCTAMAIRNAIERGDLNASKLGHVWAVVDDAALAAYAVRETGGRAHRQRGDVSAET